MLKPRTKWLGNGSCTRDALRIARRAGSVCASQKEGESACSCAESTPGPLLNDEDETRARTKGAPRRGPACGGGRGDAHDTATSPADARRRRARARDERSVIFGADRSPAPITPPPSCAVASEPVAPGTHGSDAVQQGCRSRGEGGGALVVQCTRGPCRVPAHLQRTYSGKPARAARVPARRHSAVHYRR